MSYSVKI